RHHDGVFVGIDLGNDDPALAAEQVAHRSRIGEVSTVAGEGDPDVGGGPVAVVGQALHEYRHSPGCIAFVEHCLPVGTYGFSPGPALDGAVDVVVGNRGALCLLDGVEEGRVAGGVASADAGGNFDVLHHFCEEFAPLRIVGSLLVLGRRPFRVS